MKKYAGLGFTTLAALSLVASPAWAHFALNYPPVAVAQGDGRGNEQKVGPCPVGTAPTNVVTQLRAGETIKVKFTETVAHDGHFRYSIGNPADMKAPAVTGSNCNTAAIEATPKLPTILDGVKHMGKTGMMWEQEVTIPKDFTCDKCSFQVMQFMTAHPPSCYYYRCATVTVTAAAPDGGVSGADAASDSSVTVDVARDSNTGSGGSSGASGSGGMASGAGGVAGSSGAGGVSGGLGGTTGSSGGSAGAGKGGSAGAGSGGSTSGTPSGGGSGGGCSFASSTASSSFLSAIGLALFFVLRRRRG